MTAVDAEVFDVRQCRIMIGMSNDTIGTAVRVIIPGVQDAENL